MTERETRVAQIGAFPLGDVVLPTTPAINATTVVARDLSLLAAIAPSSLDRPRASVYDNFYYGGVGTPTTAALEDGIAALEGGAHAIATPSGQSAIVATLGALLSSGDHLLVVDTVTYTTRWHLDALASRWGLRVTYFAPELGAAVETLFEARTRAILLESPGSMTFEMVDVRAIAERAAAFGILVALDNTWAASTFFAPFDHGVDICLLSLTKCHVGPTGVSMGAVVTRRGDLAGAIRNQAALLGLYVSSDACARAMLALPTLSLRLARQQENAAAALQFLRDAPGVSRIFHPSLPEASGHAIWRRDFSGANSLVSVAFQEGTARPAHALVAALRVVQIGYGWGGSTSLVSVFEANAWRSASKAPAEGLCLRFYFGLEAASDIVEDLSRAFAF